METRLLDHQMHELGESQEGKYASMVVEEGGFKYPREKGARAAITWPSRRELAAVGHAQKDASKPNIMMINHPLLWFSPLRHGKRRLHFRRHMSGALYIQDTRAPPSLQTPNSTWLMRRIKPGLN